MPDSVHRPIVLVVDDEAVITETLAAILQRNGYDVVTAYDAEEALEAILTRPPEVLISDVALPGMNGIELGLKVRHIFPGCTVILSSGKPHTSDLLEAAFAVGHHFVFLQKPVYPKVLLDHVAECLKPALV